MPFAKGQSGNPRGKPRGAHGLAKWIMSQTDDLREMMQIAMEIARSPSTSERDRLSAVQLLAERAIGKPNENIFIDANVEARAVIASVKYDLSKATEEDLLTLEASNQILAKYLLPAPAADDEEIAESEKIIDVEYEDDSAE
jgi:hypothetical protein